MAKVTKYTRLDSKPKPKVYGATPGKARRDFVCGYCQREIEDGWAYLVGTDRKVEICGECFAAPRMPPTRPMGRPILG